MKEVIIIGSGISGLACAIGCASRGIHVKLVSPGPSERAQSVMAAGGINAVTSHCEPGDSVACHIEDTLRGGAWLGERKAVEGLCTRGEEIIRFLEKIGTVFTVDAEGQPMLRAFGGQSHKRTHYCGSATGKQIVSALVMETRRYEAQGLITRVFWHRFHSVLLQDEICRGVLLLDERQPRLVPLLADAVVMAVGGQNALFGKTTGSTQCDGSAVGRLLMQGAVLKNLEFIQYHPTTLETSMKRLLISEAVRGEGGRLFYIKDGRRVYFMEDKYGPKGNLMTRDLLSREIASAPGQVYLDISFLDPWLIDQRLGEVRELCAKYRGIDITRQPIPVAPSVHFFMGGLAVHLNHETSLHRLYAVGECASLYHGANRLGGNSLLAALYSGITAAEDIAEREVPGTPFRFDSLLAREEQALSDLYRTQSPYTAMQLREYLARIMRDDMGIVRTAKGLAIGIGQVDEYLSACRQLRPDAGAPLSADTSLRGILALGRACLSCAEYRRESRGAHYREDHPQLSEDFAAATLVSYENGVFSVRADKEKCYEN